MILPNFTAHMIVDSLKIKFQAIYGQSPSVYKSPGRINIIGEHTDYNEGFVLPAAIDKAVYVAISKRADNQIHLYASKYDQHFQSSLDEVVPAKIQWANYILGVVRELQKLQLNLGGFNLALDGDVPGGAGLSSSAAVECAVAFALNDIFNLQLAKLQMVLAAQKAEHNFIGVMCGVMDQFASVFGKEEHAIKLDCKTLAHEYVPLHLPGYQLVLFNTNVKHNLSSSAYNERRASCFKGVELIKAHYPEVQSLRDTNLAMLDECVKAQDIDVYEKCKYVVEEIARLQLACEDLAANDLVALGKKMYETHEGLSKLYEVSCEELDFLVDFVKTNPHVLGARMMGGGFGGCTLNLVKQGEVEELSHKINEAYVAKFGYETTTYVVNIGNGSAKLI